MGEEEGEMPAGAAGDPLDRFEEYLKVCLWHLDKSADRDTLEPVLVRFLLVAACGAYEKTIRGAVDQRMKNSGDVVFVRYLGRATDRYGMAFGTVSAGRFVRVLDELPGTAGMPLAKAVKDAHDKLLQDRNSVAHGGETEITLNELQHMHRMARGVPLAFAATLRHRFD